MAGRAWFATLLSLRPPGCASYTECRSARARAGSRKADTWMAGAHSSRKLACGAGAPSWPTLCGEHAENAGKARVPGGSALGDQPGAMVSGGTTYGSESAGGGFRAWAEHLV